MTSGNTFYVVKCSTWALGPTFIKKIEFTWFIFLFKKVSVGLAPLYPNMNVIHVEIVGTVIILLENERNQVCYYGNYENVE